ncbi:DUF2399 domain-containing protein [Saccharopolyspora cebuensis]|uniref:DUF2399 domain-containing protein n=1 Tax=Saccharopolyspora cebuensis TaxID=418759 RepID=A0ABV4CJL6_9PSEU
MLEIVHTRARRGHRTEAGTLAALALSAEQRKQVALVLGTGWELSGKPVRLQDLAARLAEHQLTVRGLVESLWGEEIEPDRARRDRERDAAEAEREDALRALIVAGAARSDVEQWSAGGGLPKPGTGELTTLVEQITAVLSRLHHANGGIRLGQLAADLSHDAHTLDADKLLGRATARLLAITSGLPRPQRAGRAWRAAWASAGVLCDGVSSRVLALNLPISGDSAAARLCTAAPGEPIWLTLRALTGAWTAPACDIFLCENPTLAEAAADALGVRCPPLVCTDGVASGAALDLLAGFAEMGCTIHARADFDTAGFTIADQVLSVAPHARSWRFDTRTYARERGLSQQYDPAEDLASAVIGLRNVYGQTPVPVHEERLLDTLIADLAATGRTPDVTAMRQQSC